MTNALTGLRRYITAQPGVLACFILVIVASSALTLTLPLFLAHALDRGLAGGGRQESFIVGGLVFVTLVAAMVLRSVFGALLAERVVRRIRESLLRSVLGRNGEFFDSNTSGELLSRLTLDVDMVRALISDVAPGAIRAIMVGSGSLLIIFATDAFLASILVGGVLLSLLPVVLASGWLDSLSQASQEKLASAVGIMRENLGAVRTIQTYSAIDHACANAGQSLMTANMAADRRVFAHGWIALASMLIASLTVGMCLWLAVGYVESGRFSVGDFGRFVGAALIATFSLASLAELWGEVVRISGGVKEVLHLLDTAGSISPERAQEVPVASGPEVMIEGIRFAYSTRPNVDVLRDVSITIRQGEVLALAGRSGSGKSTLLALLAGFYAPSAGWIAINGISPVERSRLRVGYVPQNPALFSGTLEENIRLGCTSATSIELNAAIRRAGLGSVVCELPHGALLGDEKNRLSGGQKQRVEIARALIRKPTLLLLDEPTSALDGESEGVVLRGLRGEDHSTTVVIASHREKTLESADRVAFFDSGTCIAVDSHQRLLARMPEYRAFVRASPFHGETDIVERATHG